MNKTLDEQQQEFAKRRFLAMPLAGTIIWTLIGISSLYLTRFQIVWVTFIGSGMTIYLGMFISRFTGEHFLDKKRSWNTFDSLFLMTVLMTVLVNAIAIPFFLLDQTSLPLTFGIMFGLMWVPLTWMIKHWIGVVHAVVRTALIVAAWYLFPLHRFTVIPFVIVAVYLFSIVVLERRFKQINVT